MYTGDEILNLTKKASIDVNDCICYAAFFLSF